MLNLTRSVAVCSIVEREARGMSVQQVERGAGWVGERQSQSQSQALLVFGLESAGERLCETLKHSTS